MLRSTFVVFSLLFAATAIAQVHKCVDSSGRVTYSQVPCPPKSRSGSISRHIDEPPAAPAAEPAPGKGGPKAASAKNTGPKTPAEQEQAFRKRLQEQEKAQKEADQKNAQEKAKEASCRAAKERLTQYEIGGRISRIDAQGQRYYLGDAEIEQQKASARADVEQACN
jgi:hypothetical protein